MFSLIYKDMLIMKKYFLICVPFIISIVYIGCNKEELQPSCIIFTIFMITYLMLYYILGQDDRNKSEVVLNSLPINRANIVTAKYLNVLLISFFIWLFQLIMSMVFGVAGIGLYRFQVRFEYLLVTLVILSIYFSLYYPLYFKLGSFKLRSFNTFMSLFIIILPSIVKRFRDTYIIKVSGRIFLLLVQSSGFIYLLLLFSIILFLGSMILSKKIYLNREF